MHGKHASVGNLQQKASAACIKQITSSVHVGKFVIANSACISMQVLTSRYSRRLITMEKVDSFHAESSLAHLKQQQNVLASLDETHESVFQSRLGRKPTKAEKRAAKPMFRSKCCYNAGEREREREAFYIHG